MKKSPLTLHLPKKSHKKSFCLKKALVLKTHTHNKKKRPLTLHRPKKRTQKRLKKSPLTLYSPKKYFLSKKHTHITTTNCRKILKILENDGELLENLLQLIIL